MRNISRPGLMMLAVLNWSKYLQINSQSGQFLLNFSQVDHCFDIALNWTVQGVSKKMLVSGKMAITPLWKELGEEVIPFWKTTGSELSDEHKNFMILSKNDWDNCIWSWQPYLQKKEKNLMKMLYTGCPKIKHFHFFPLFWR